MPGSFRDFLKLKKSGAEAALSTGIATADQVEKTRTIRQSLKCHGGPEVEILSLEIVSLETARFGGLEWGGILLADFC